MTEPNTNACDLTESVVAFLNASPQSITCRYWPLPLSYTLPELATLRIDATPETIKKIEGTRRKRTKQVGVYLYVQQKIVTVADHKTIIGVIEKILDACEDKLFLGGQYHCKDSSLMNDEFRDIEIQWEEQIFRTIIILDFEHVPPNEN